MKTIDVIQRHRKIINNLTEAIKMELKGKNNYFLICNYRDQIKDRISCLEKLTEKKN